MGIMGRSKKNLVDHKGELKLENNDKKVGRWTIISTKSGKACDGFKGLAREVNKVRPGSNSLQEIGFDHSMIIVLSICKQTETLPSTTAAMLSGSQIRAGMKAQCLESHTMDRSGLFQRVGRRFGKRIPKGRRCAMYC